MPALPLAPNTLKVQLTWTVGTNTNVQNVLHYNWSGSRPAVNDCVAIGNHFLASFLSAQGALFHTATVLTACTVTDLANTDGAVGVAQASHPGTDIRAPVPENTCTLMSLKINARYRGGHPRIYFPPMTTGVAQDSKSWTATAATNFNNTMLNMLNSLPGYATGPVTVGQQVALSYVKGHTWQQDQHGNWKRMPTYRSTPLPIVISSWVTSQKMATQRRRFKH
jgi:hypothetical protein